MGNKGELFSVIGDPTRKQILQLLAQKKSLRAKDILEHLKISQPTLSHHMQLLSEEKIVHCKKIGRECFYSVNALTVISMIDELKSLLPDQKEEEKTSSASEGETVSEDKKKNKEKKDRKDKKKKKKNK